LRHPQCDFDGHNANLTAFTIYQPNLSLSDFLVYPWALFNRPACLGGSPHIQELPPLKVLLRNYLHWLIQSKQLGCCTHTALLILAQLALGHSPSLSPA
jgi:hypothetical protein